MDSVNASKPHSTPNTKPATSAPTSTEPSRELTPQERFRIEADADEKRLQTSDLSKVKVW